MGLARSSLTGSKMLSDVDDIVVLFRESDVLSGADSESPRIFVLSM